LATVLRSLCLECRRLRRASSLRTDRLFGINASPDVARRVLIITIISMVLISIQPFAFKKAFLLVATLLCLSSAICLADSLFMSLHSRPYGRQMNRLQATPLSTPEGTVQPLFLVVCQSLDGKFAQDSGWILSGTFVLNPMSDWPTDRSGEIGDRSYTPLCTYARGRIYHAASSTFCPKI
jgi:hypothetical protein